MERSLTPKGQRARAKILSEAERLIAAHGFHGASMRDIARAAKLPLATTIYHFAKKEQLYASLLHAIAEDLDERLAADSDLATVLVHWAADEPARVKLLLRELLDNPSRVAKASSFPLAPFLERATTLVGNEVAVLHVVGAISYFVAAWPTVERIVGAPRAKKITATYERDAIAFARRMLGGRA